MNEMKFPVLVYVYIIFCWHLINTYYSDMCAESIESTLDKPSISFKVSKKNAAALGWIFFHPIRKLYGNCKKSFVNTLVMANMAANQKPSAATEFLFLQWSVRQQSSSSLCLSSMKPLVFLLT